MEVRLIDTLSLCKPWPGDVHQPLEPTEQPARIQNSQSCWKCQYARATGSTSNGPPRDEAEIAQYYYPAVGYFLQQIYPELMRAGNLDYPPIVIYSRKVT